MAPDCTVVGGNEIGDMVRMGGAVALEARADAWFCAADFSLARPGQGVFLAEPSDE
jgi:hypothetical protein